MSNPGLLMRWRQKLRARWAAPRRLWLRDESHITTLGDGDSVAWADWMAQHPGHAVELIVSAALQHQLVCEPGLPLSGGAAVQVYASQQFSHYFGSAAHRWAFAPWLSADRCGAVALHGVDMQHLRDGARDHRVSLRSMRPAWSAVLPWVAAELPTWAAAENAALAWVEGALLTWVRFAAGHCIDVRHVRLTVASHGALSDTLQSCLSERAAGSVAVLGYGLSGEQTPPLSGVQYLDGLTDAAPRAPWFNLRLTAKNASWPRPDFIAQATPRSWLALPLAATGALMLGVVIWTAIESRDTLLATQERLRQVSQRNTLAKQASAAVGKSNAVASIATTDWRAAREAKLLLQQPWEAILADVERVGADGSVHWLTLDVQAQGNNLQLEGLAVNKAAALQVAESLSGDPGWTDVLLRRLQSAEGGLQRFELGARLQPAAMRGPADLGAPR